MYILSYDNVSSTENPLSMNAQTHPWPTAHSVEDFRRNLAAVHRRIADACSRAGRDPSDVRLLPVSKTVDEARLRIAYAVGLRELGENKVQEAVRKHDELADLPVRWSLIGHLQRNKARAAVELFPCIHAVDSMKLLEQIARVAEETGLQPSLLLEINASGESSKFGLKPEEAPAVIERALTLRQVTLTGLMTLAPIAPDPELTRPVFAKVRECRDRWERQFGIALPELSMGMSGDFEVAIEEGATWIRIGTALFGNRPRWKPERGSEDQEEQSWTLE